MRPDQLRAIRDALSRLVPLLEKDPRCGWTGQFRSALAWSEDLLQRNGDPDEGRRLLHALRNALGGGAGTFGDYVPVLPATEAAVYEAAPWAADMRDAADALSRLIDKADARFHP